MAKNVVLILEYGNGGYSCYNDEPLGNYGVIDGDGATAEEAKADFMKALQECREDDPNNKDLQDLTFTYKYDVQAFGDTNYYWYKTLWKVCFAPANAQQIAGARLLFQF